jgi:hypothetical protein
VTLLAAGAKRHGVEAISSEAAQPTQVLERLPALALEDQERPDGRWMTATQ